MEKALSVVYYTILWSIIGIVIIYIGFSIYQDTKNLIFEIILYFIGAIIISCGFLASFMKINTELILEELKISNIKSEEPKQIKDTPKNLETINMDGISKNSEEKYSIVWDIIIVISIIIFLYTIILYY